MTITDKATDLAEEVLFPNALEVERAENVPVSNLEQIVESGLYGLIAPTDLGGAGADMSTLLDVIETFAGGCLNTCFVWTQHQGATRAVVESEQPVHDAWAQRLSRGEARSGVAFAHLLRPGPPAITAEPDGDHWRLTGVAPWVTGWGYIDVFHVAARHGDDIVWALIDARPSPSMHAELLRLAAINASGTFQIRLENHLIEADRVTSIQPYDEWMAQYPHGLRVNGSLSLGVAERARSLLGPSRFDSEFDEARAALDAATVDELPEARGHVSALTVRLTASLVASVGGRSIVADHHGQRLAREALFLLIQGQTPEIKQSLLRHL